jgi:hypothetical protein
LSPIRAREPRSESRPPPPTARSRTSRPSYRVAFDISRSPNPKHSCIDARHAKAVLKMQINRSDRNDAACIARIMQTGWFKEVRVKDLDSHSVRALLASRALLVKVRRDLEIGR